MRTSHFGRTPWVAALLLAAICGSAQAVDYTFISATGGWEVPNNWSPNGVPGPGDNATLSGTVSCTVSDARSVGILAVTGGAVLTITAPGTLACSALTFNSGTITGTGALSISTACNWNPTGNATFSGTGTTSLLNGCTGTIGGTSFANINQRSVILDNGATLNYQPTQALTISNGGRLQIDQGGVFDLQNDVAINGNTGGLLNLAGELRKSAGTGTSVLQTGIQQSATGVVKVGTGTLALTGSSALRNSIVVDPGAVLSMGAGTHTVPGALTVSGDFRFGGTFSVSATASFNNAQLTGGTVTNTGTLNFTGTFLWTGGGINGAGTTNFAAGSVVSINGSSFKTFDTGALAVSGSVTYAPPGPSTGRLTFGLGASVSIESTGLIALTTDCDLNSSGSTTLVNRGQLRKTAGTGSSNVVPVVDNQGGTVEAQTGTLNFQNGLTQASGTVRASGGTLNASIFQINGGSIGGFGTINGTVNNAAGTLYADDGVTSGALTFGGTVTQGSGATLRLWVEGAVPGTDYGDFTFNSVTLNGALQVVLRNGYVIPPNDVYQFITATTLAGTFATVDNGGSGFGPEYGAGFVNLSRLLNTLVLDAAVALPNPARAGGDVVFTANVSSNTLNLPLTYTWSFSDGSSASGNPVTKNFTPTADTTISATVTVSDTTQTLNAAVDVPVLAPPANAQGTGLPDGEMSENPLNGLTITVTKSEKGLAELEIDPTALSRAGFGSETDFASDSASLPKRSGLKVVQKFTDAGVFVATTTVTDAATGETRGKGRKMLPVSRKEVGKAESNVVEPANRVVQVTNVKGKFLFTSEKPDQITFNGTFEVPAGLDLRLNQELSFAIGNVVDTAQVTPKGKGLLPSTLGTVKKLQVKYPKVNKDNPVTTAGQTAKLSVTYFTANLDLKGFDTEGVTNRVKDSEAGMKAVPRTIQMAMVFGGVSYEASVPVDFKLAKNTTSGQIATRRIGQ